MVKYPVTLILFTLSPNFTASKSKEIIGFHLVSFLFTEETSDAAILILDEGDELGIALGIALGTLDSELLGTKYDLELDATDGTELGNNVGMLLGIDEGVELGITPGTLDSELLRFKGSVDFGGTDGIEPGNDVGMLLGIDEGVELGISLGSLDCELLGTNNS